MKQWIREHPWRLEIVPALIIVLAAVLPLVFRNEMILSQWQSASRGAEYWQSKYICGLLMPLVFFSLALMHNHLRARDGESGWRNSSMGWPPLMALYAKDMCDWSIDGDMVHLHGLGPAVSDHAYWYGLVWWAIIASSLLAQAIIEWTWHPVPVEGSRSTQAAENVRPGDRFYYRESMTHWDMLLIPLIIGAMYVVILSSHDGRYWLWILLFLVVLPPIAAGAWARFTVSNERLTARVGFRRLVLAMEDIRCCSVERPAPREHPPFVPRGKVGPCLRVETEFESYLFGMRNPEVACALINTAIAARGKNE